MNAVITCNQELPNLTAANIISVYSTVNMTVTTYPIDCVLERTYWYKWLNYDHLSSVVVKVHPLKRVEEGMLKVGVVVGGA